MEMKMKKKLSENVLDKFSIDFLRNQVLKNAYGTDDTVIARLPQTAPIFLSIGMHCLGCPSSRGETVEEACAVHGIDVDKLLELVNEEANKPIAE